MRRLTEDELRKIASLDLHHTEVREAVAGYLAQHLIKRLGLKADPFVLAASLHGALDACAQMMNEGLVALAEAERLRSHGSKPS